ncbi:MAG: hypothetical protein R3321_07295 [Nitrososphaeraceae archaeon]|nr:hypothetical protein [Nitrososphaeraceae archaeon]
MEIRYSFKGKVGNNFLKLDRVWLMFLYSSSLMCNKIHAVGPDKDHRGIYLIISRTYPSIYCKFSMPGNNRSDKFHR